MVLITIKYLLSKSPDPPSRAPRVPLKGSIRVPLRGSFKGSIGLLGLRFRYKSCITLRALNYGTYGIILIMRITGFISSTVGA